MAASDQNYRDQKVLDWVFAASCILMLVVTVWMFVQDFNRPYKQVQRDFRNVEEAMAQRAVLDQAPDANKLAEIVDAEKNVEKARADFNKKKNEIAPKINEQLPIKIRAEDAYRSIKADYDSIVSLYDIAIEELNGATERTARARAKKETDRLYEEVRTLRQKLEDAKVEADKQAFELDRISYDAGIPGLAKRLSEAEDVLKKLTFDFDRFGKLVEQKRWGMADNFRRLPILDAFNSPIRIHQIVLEQLPIDYGGFKYVTRYDRCMTCHQGIDRPAFTQDALRALGQTDSPDVQEKLKNARAAIEKRLKAGGTSPISPDDLTLDPVNLSRSQVVQYAAHPRLDLFVDGNSPHSSEKFGCTICHAGQGSGTDFYGTSHTPNNSLQAALWAKSPSQGGQDWKSSHYWDFPMLPNRFIESSCVKCHHQMTDLIADGSRIEAPKLMRGYQLVKDNGCFGCHEIAGNKGGRSIGPDLRLEPSPPLDAYTPIERAKMTADAQAPPGTMRKVGPSLKRLTEKTNTEWLVRWLRSPRDFRPDTKMPHFYGLSNNHPDVLPKSEQAFPDTEIHAVAHYLMTESSNYLQGKDRAHLAAKAKVAELQQLVKENTISEAQRKELYEIERRLELNFVPAPLVRKVKGPDGKEIEELVLDAQGKDAIPLPAAPADEKARTEAVAKGRNLFSEKGCLACHIHEGTQTDAKMAGLTLPGVTSTAQFGPNLSRLAAKLGTKPGDTESARRWLIRWVLNPNAHFPRTRMPITHLTPTEANDVALWLLSQKVDDSWIKETPAAPTTEDLKSLARVSLSRSFTRSEVDRILENGLTAEELKLMGKPIDAEERELESNDGEAKSMDNKFKMYVGKKAVGQLGCFACHDIPGFENAKPIGTPLNDWGKKDNERIAFEDVAAFVKKNFTIVDQLKNSKGEITPMQKDADGNPKPLFERFFFDALDHHMREGFLYQKLNEPRSFDYDRLRVWDERLRMPQFRFARSEKRAEESEAQFHARLQVEESEAREAVMTFILGLVAEPIPLKFVNQPPPDRLNEIKGRQVLEKFNCGGCHLVRPGVYEFKTGADTLPKLRDNFETARRTFASDFFKEHIPLLEEHNAWIGLPQKRPDRLRMFGLLKTYPAAEEGQPPEQMVLLTDALRTTEKAEDGTVMNFPAATSVSLPPKLSIPAAPEFGGAFGTLLAGYLMKQDPVKYKDETLARASVPPWVVRQGERTQPTWLYSFLKEPTPIRPMVVLRMPKFNMSDEDAQSLVNYFSSVTKLDNPGIGLTAPYFASPEREESYLRAQNEAYVAQLKKAKLPGKDQTLFDQRLEEMKPIWEDTLRVTLAESQVKFKAAEAALEKAKAAVEKENDAAKKAPLTEAVKAATAARDAAQKAQEQAQTALDKKDVAPLRKAWERDEVYLADGFKLLINSDLCTTCHQVGPYPPKGNQGPPLALSYQRLRSDWTLRWIAKPERLSYYPPVMPQNFTGDAAKFQDVFHGKSFHQATAARDALMNFPRALDLPVFRTRPVTVAGGEK